MKIGDKVKVTNKGCIYTSYVNFAECYNLKNWKYGREFADDNVYEIKIIGLHLENEEKVLCVIADENEQEYIIGIDGLEKIEDRKRLIQSPDFKRITNIIVDIKDILELNLSNIDTELQYEDIENIEDEKLIRIIKNVRI